MKNMKSKKLNKRIIAIISIVLVAIILITTVICLVTKKDENVEVENTGRIQKQAMNPNNYTMVKSKDGIDVPVPKGYTASDIDTERYVNGMYKDIIAKWCEVDLMDKFVQSSIVSNDLGLDEYKQCQWMKNENGVLVSGNANVDNSISEISTKFSIGENGGKVSISYAVSSEKNDTLSIWLCLDGGLIPMSSESVVDISGIECGTAESELNYKNVEFEISNAGNYQIIIYYMKDDSKSEALDKGFIKDAKLINELEYTDGNSPVLKEEIIKREQLVNGGFVIYEGNEEVTDSNKWEAQATRNQYVWIPISDVKDMYWIDQNTDKIYGTAYIGDENGYKHRENEKNEPQLVKDDTESGKLTNYMGGLSRFEYLQQMEQDFYEMLQSVATYGGFYIGRYEVGNILNEGENGNAVLKDLAVKRFNIDIAGNIDANIMTLYNRCKKMSTNNSSIVTHVIWGTQYDQVLKWIIDTGAKSNSEVWKDSTTWGNYEGITGLEYYAYDEVNKTAKIKIKDNNYELHNGILLSTGSYEGGNANNIYDLAGNVKELTMEAGADYGYYASYRFFRGGSLACLACGVKAYAEDGFHLPDGTESSYRGVRTTLYIK